MSKLPPSLLLLWHFVSSKGNNKVSTIVLNHFPAYKWAHIKHSTPRRTFYRAVNSFVKIWWKTDRLQNFRPPESSLALHFAFEHLVPSDLEMVD